MFETRSVTQIYPDSQRAKALQILTVALKFMFMTHPRKLLKSFIPNIKLHDC